MTAAGFFPVAGTHVLKMESDHLDPEIQVGDNLVVMPADKADEGALVIVVHEDSASVAHNWPQLQGRVVGVVIGLYRNIA